MSASSDAHVRFYQGTAPPAPDYKPPARPASGSRTCPASARTTPRSKGALPRHGTPHRPLSDPAGALVIGRLRGVHDRDRSLRGRSFSLFRRPRMASPHGRVRPITIQVGPSPAARPGYSGAVGRFTIAARSIRRPCVGEAGSLTYPHRQATSGPRHRRCNVPGLRSFDRERVTDQNKADGGGTKKLTGSSYPNSAASLIPALLTVFRRTGRLRVVRPSPSAHVSSGKRRAPAPARNVVAPGGLDLRFIRLGDPGLVLHRKIL